MVLELHQVKYSQHACVTKTPLMRINYSHIFAKENANG